MTISLRCRFVSMMLALAAAGPLAAAWSYQQDIAPADLAGGTNGLAFGKTIAADVRPDGRIRALYVGAPNATVTVSGTDHPGAGKVYVYTPTGGWHLATTITATGGFVQDGAHFGAALAVHEGVLAVGTPDYDYPGHGNGGAMLVFQDSTRDAPGDVDPVIQPCSPCHRVSQGDDVHFGASVAVGGSTLANGAWIASGAPGEYDGNGCVRIDYHAGSTHTYGGAACSAVPAYLGSSLALYSESQTFYVLVAGAPGVQQGTQALAGEAHVYVPIDGTITRLDTLKAGNPAFLDAFGSAVAMDATHIYVGGTGRVKNGVGRTGSVSVFEPSGLIGWSFDTELFPGGGAAAGDLCGASLSARHETDGVVAMGCPGHDGLVANEGAVRVMQLFDLLGTPIWAQDRLDMADLPHGADDLGRDVALAGDHVFAGAPAYDDAIGMNNGSVRVFATDRIFSDGFDP